MAARSGAAHLPSSPWADRRHANVGQLGFVPTTVPFLVPLASAACALGRVQWAMGADARVIADATGKLGSTVEGDGGGCKTQPWPPQECMSNTKSTLSADRLVR